MGYSGTEGQVADRAVVDPNPTGHLPSLKASVFGTLVLGPLGLVWVVRDSRRARDAGGRGGHYWVAYALAQLLNAVVVGVALSLASLLTLLMTMSGGPVVGSVDGSVDGSTSGSVDGSASGESSGVWAKLKSLLPDGAPELPEAGVCYWSRDWPEPGTPDAEDQVDCEQVHNLEVLTTGGEELSCEGIASTTGVPGRYRLHRLRWVSDGEAVLYVCILSDNVNTSDPDTYLGSYTDGTIRPVG